LAICIENDDGEDCEGKRIEYGLGGGRLSPGQDRE
jgi:hypothetical protein